jgi:DNA-binding transcriptional ArsR family regulator
MNMALWTFLTNHSLVLSFLARHPMITARELSLQIGITERAIRKIIADLEKEGYIIKKKEGRRVRYTINPRIPLRHKTQRDKAVGELLHVLGTKFKKPLKKRAKRR